MIRDLDILFKRYRSKGILVDTNILLLWFVGATNRDRISRFKRTQQFSTEDYDLLIRIISDFHLIVTTPNILTEVNSLANQLAGDERNKCLAVFASIVDNLTEVYLESHRIVKLDHFSKYGLTDSGIINLVANQYLVLTDDLKLASYLQSQSIDVINFNHLRF
ncbi:MAG: PIN domain-containing protein [Limnospira sp. PMC 1291.21]|uniref:PIN domain-containing protein n=1 Tax=unclassified Limnospira TaxID=2642885 RepID=UPI0028E115F0|nr:MULTISPECIES: PIN domain-containing protein [unclassified Limnospira]MDT9179225.1 PIN domain-containing protein [Limnospira sp. PMC 1238.20]MDT9193826.1 PIN domain-containing protein [Limnospira sp. PMC 1245.20]MDT9204016.1 PIN domain-containing protein [Limnospira sp. PMC 1243.20]MDT9209200.1 PIN domain-containing protein [Limnospira sp. PMC 1252.20]MDT9214428.1 PIN domain-containing protein [Limnospira sp. PMC 1256.20]